MKVSPHTTKGGKALPCSVVNVHTRPKPARRRAGGLYVLGLQFFCPVPNVYAWIYIFNQIFVPLPRGCFTLLPTHPATPRELFLSPTLQPSPLLKPQGRLNGADWSHFLSSFLWKASQLRPGKGGHHTPEAPWKSNGEPGMGSAGPFRLLLWYLWYRLGFL